jgi:hypothetical protein
MEMQVKLPILEGHFHIRMAPGQFAMLMSVVMIFFRLHREKAEAERNGG